MLWFFDPNPLRDLHLSVYLSVHPFFDSNKILNFITIIKFLSSSLP
jgi:hypothetical protein